MNTSSHTKSRATQLASFPLLPASPLANIAPATIAEAHTLASFTAHVVPLAVARQMFAFTKTTFWRFRIRHRIETLTGGRIDVRDILAGFAAERHGKRLSA